MATIFVSPSKEIDATNGVAIWDQSHDHFEVDPAWDALKCLWIEGNKDNPGKVYAVADTDFVKLRISLNFLREVDTPIIAGPALKKADK